MSNLKICYFERRVILKVYFKLLSKLQLRLSPSLSQAQDYPTNK